MKRARNEQGENGERNGHIVSHEALGRHRRNRQAARQSDRHLKTGGQSVSH